MTKYKVHEGMLEAAGSAVFRYVQALSSIMEFDDNHAAKVALEAAIRYWSENPIVPTDSEVMTILQERVASGHITNEEYCAIPPATVRFVVRELQRRMFLAPEPEVPEDDFDQAFVFNAILHRPATQSDYPSDREKAQGIQESVTCVKVEDYAKLLKAYRLIQKSKTISS